MMVAKDRTSRPQRMMRACCVAAAAGLAATVVPMERVIAQSIPPSVTIEAIEVRGNRRIEPATIQLYSGLQVGATADAEELNLSTRKIFATGLFADVNIRPEGRTVVIEVEENPSINRINFEGNDLIDDETLTGIVSARPRLAYSAGLAEADAQLIIEAYRQSGRYGASVRPVIIPRSDNRVDLVFEIYEGDVTEIEGINFVGNERISDRRLRGAIQSQEAGWLSFLFTSDNYDPDRLEVDKEMLRRYYLENGFADFTVLSATADMSIERDGFYVTYALSEGQPYTFGETSVVSEAEGLNPDDFLPLIETVPGEDYDIRAVERTVDAMTFLAGEKGYAFVRVQPRVIKDEENHVIGIEYQLVQGPKVYVERIDIRGNTSTLDRVIRRQFDIVEGDAFDSRAIQRARDNIRNLDFFETSDVRVEQGADEDRAIVVVDVEEKLTGSIGFGVGYSSSDGAIGSVSISERNFLGRGQRVSANLTVAGEEQAIGLDFFEPAFLDRDLGAGFNIFYRRTDRADDSTYASYNETDLGFIPRVVFPTSEDGSLELHYELSSSKIDPIIRSSGRSASEFIIAEEGQQITSSIGYMYTWDERDAASEPREGYILSFGQDVAGLGGDAYYLRNVARAKGYTSFMDGDVVLSAEVEGGALVSFDNDSTVVDRFFLGGDSFRGFGNDGIGPRDVSTDFNGTPVNDALGGNFYSVARFQASFPMGLPDEYGVFGGLFADVGTLWGLDKTVVSDGSQTRRVDDGAHIRAAVGFSLFWDSAFGPLRFNFAYPVLAEDYDDKEYFRFTAGTRF